MYINGNWTSACSGNSFPVNNPANGELIAEVADGGAADALLAIDAADEAFKHWSSLTAYQRSEYLYKAWEIMMERREAIARVMTAEQGKPIKAARNEADFLGIGRPCTFYRVQGRRSC